MLLGHGSDGQPNCITLMCHPRHFDSVEQYIHVTRMDQNGEWGTNVEMACLAHLIVLQYTAMMLLNLTIYGLRISLAMLIGQFLEMSDKGHCIFI